MNWSIFDKIYCIHYLPYRERYENIKNILNKLGILNLPQFEWYYTADNICYDMLYKILLDKKIIFSMEDKEATKHKVEGYIRNNRVFNLAINEFNLLVKAFYLNFQNILIIEDDICPLKDIRLFEKYINNYPTNYDIVSMEYWLRDENDKYTLFSENRRINDYFYFVSKERLVNASFIGLSRKGIKHIIDNMKQHFICSDYYIANQETYDDWFIKRAVSKIPLCIQEQNYKMNHDQNMKWNYDHINLDISNYINSYEK